MPAPAYADTRVTVDKSREQISKIVAATWKATGMQWEDEFATGSSVLRFRWKPDATKGDEVVVRLRLDVTPHPSRHASTKQRDERRTTERKRLHRVAFWWLKAMAEAIDAGLLQRETCLLAWVETPRGSTIGEMLLPNVALVSSGRLALPASSGQ